jgi:hypothetical protein
MINDAPYYKDFLGQKVHVGDDVLFAASVGHTPYLRRGTITSIQVKTQLPSEAFAQRVVKIQTSDASARVFKHERSVKVPHGL